MKKILPFILILSLLIPFFPQFDYEVQAYVDTTSQNSFIQNLVDLYQTYFGSNGVVVNSDWYNSTYPQGLLNDVCDNLGLEPIDNDFGSAIYDYSVTNNQTADMIFNDSYEYVDNKVNDMIPYYIYDFINIDDFFNYYQFLNYPIEAGYQGLSSFKLALENLCSDSSFVYMLSTELATYSQAKYLYRTHLIKIPRDYFEDNYLALKSGQFSGIQNYSFQSFRKPRDGASIPTFSNFSSSYLRVFDGLEYVTRDDSWTIYRFKNSANGNWYNGYETLLGSPSYSIYTGLINDSSSWFGGSFNGTAFIYSGQTFSLPVFKSTNLVSDFASGNSFVYKFDKNIDIPDGADIDYSRLYDIISNEVSHSSGNVIDAINGVANNYLEEQLELLHDINNALNDGTGQSWLRRIYGILDYNFPLTLEAFDDLKEAIQNISVSGGTADFSEATRVLHEIDDKLGFLIEQPIDDATANDFDELKNLASSKFPFCIFSDIVAITVILNRSPRQPDINFNIPIGSPSENIVHVDLSPYEYARPYVHGALIFLFVIGLMALSVKIFSALKG